MTLVLILRYEIFQLDIYNISALYTTKHKTVEVKYIDSSKTLPKYENNTLRHMYIVHS